MAMVRRSLSIVLCVSSLIISTVTYAASTTLFEKVQVRENEVIGTVVAELSSFLAGSQFSHSKNNFKLLSQKLSSSSLRSSNNIRWFSLNEITGTLTVRRKLDREEMCSNYKTCTVHVQVYAKTNSKIIQLDVEIVDVNEHPPLFQIKFISLNISEGAAIGSTINLDRYLAFDKDSGNNSAITYSLQANGYFALHQNIDETETLHLQLVIEQRLDYETRSIFQLSLFAKDGGFPSLSSHIPFQVNIIDENDNEPIFELQKYEVTIAENAHHDQVIAHVQASDADSKIFGAVTYFISGPNGDEASSTFSVDPTSGDVYLVHQLDREKNDEYVVFLEARDGGNPAKVGRSRLLVQIGDVNDNAPYITISFIASSQGNTVFVPESMPIDSYVAYVSAKDIDLDASSDVIITMKVLSLWDKSDDGKYFDASGIFELKENGIIELVRPLDADIQNNYKLILNATDRGINPLWSTKEVDIIVLDENDHDPQFSKQLYKVSLLEDISVGTTIFKMQATDLDGKTPSALQMNKAEKLVPSSNGNITYSISEGYSTFSISPRTGIITLIRPLDREQTAKWTITITASDAGYPFSRSSSCELTVTVLDVNDNAPVFTNPSREGTTLHASVLRDAVITRIQAVDFDAGNNGKLKFSLLKVNGVEQSEHRNNSIFILDSSSGDLRLNRSNPKLLTSIGHYELFVQARDEGFPPMTTKRSFNVVVSDDVMLPTQKPASSNNKSMIPTTIVIIITASITFALLLCGAAIIIAYKCAKKHKKEQPGKTETNRVEGDENPAESATQRLYKINNERHNGGSGSGQLPEYKHLIQRNSQSVVTDSENIYGSDPLLRIQTNNASEKQFQLNLPANISNRLICNFSKEYGNSFDCSKREDGDSGQGDSDQDTGSGNRSYEHNYVELKGFDFQPNDQINVNGRHTELRWIQKQRGPEISTSHQPRTYSTSRPCIDVHSSMQALPTDSESSKHPRNLDAIPENYPMKMFWSPNSHIHKTSSNHKYQDTAFYHSPRLDCYSSAANEPIKSHFAPIGSSSDSATTGYVTESELV